MNKAQMIDCIPNRKAPSNHNQQRKEYKSAIPFRAKSHCFGLNMTLLAAFYLQPTNAAAQSLDEAVNAQLEIINIECDRLLNGDVANITALRGELLRLCQRGQPAGDPGTSSVSGGSPAASVSMPNSIKDRVGPEGNQLEQPARGFFLSVSSGKNNREITKFQDGHDSNIAALVAGFDYEYSDWVAGFSVEYTTKNGDYSSGGDFTYSAFGSIAFANYAFNTETDLDLYVGYVKVSAQQNRMASFTEVDDAGFLFYQADGNPSADFRAQELLSGGQLSYAYSINNITIAPKLALDLQRTRTDTYSESETVESGLALRFHDQVRSSLVSTLGVDTSIAVSTKFGVVLVGEYAYWKHEFDDRQRELDVSFVDDTRNQRFSYQTAEPDTDYYVFGINITLLFHGGLQSFIGYEKMASHRHIDTRLFSAGIRKEF